MVRLPSELVYANSAPLSLLTKESPEYSASLGRLKSVRDQVSTLREKVNSLVIGPCISLWKLTETELSNLGNSFGNMRQIIDSDLLSECSNSPFDERSGNFLNENLISAREDLVSCRDLISKLADLLRGSKRRKADEKRMEMAKGSIEMAKKQLMLFVQKLYKRAEIDEFRCQSDIQQYSTMIGEEMAALCSVDNSVS